MLDIDSYIDYLTMSGRNSRNSQNGMNGFGESLTKKENCIFFFCSEIIFKKSIKLKADIIFVLNFYKI